MRSFPRIPRQRLVAAMAVATLCVGVTVPLAEAGNLKQRENDARSEQRGVRKDISKAEDALHESSKRLSRAIRASQAARDDLRAARDDLAAAKDRARAAKERDELMQDRLVRAKERLKQARIDVANGQQAVDDQSVAVENMVNSIYQQGDPQLLAIGALMNSDSAADLTREAEARKVIVGSETRAYDELRAAEVLLTVREQQVADAKDEVAAAAEEAAAIRVEMRNARIDAHAAKESFQARAVSASAARQKAQRIKWLDRIELDKLKRQEARIQRMIDRLVQQQQAAAAAQGSQTSGPPDGLLSRPSTGYTTSPFGYRIHPIYGYYGLHDGVDFGLGCGTPLTAVSSGRVISRWYSSVYGNRLYIALGVINGKSLVAVYNHMDSYAPGMTVGSSVSRGQQVGTMGNTGWSTGCHLHFTLLVNGKAADPMPWF